MIMDNHKDNGIIQVLPVELVQGITFGLFFPTLVSVSAKIAPPGEDNHDHERDHYDQADNDDDDDDYGSLKIYALSSNFNFVTQLTKPITITIMTIINNAILSCV